MQANSKKDFSLIKMLIVITMITVLALIAISTYRGGRTQKRNPRHCSTTLALSKDLTNLSRSKKTGRTGRRRDLYLYRRGASQDRPRLGYPLNGTYYLMADLDLSGVGGEEGWVPIGFPKDQNHNVMDTRLSFVGTFDGNGCVIRHRPNQPS